jgi:hypothetical protein
VGVVLDILPEGIETIASLITFIVVVIMSVRQKLVNLRVNKKFNDVNLNICDKCDGLTAIILDGTTEYKTACLSEYRAFKKEDIHKNNTVAELITKKIDLLESDLTTELQSVLNEILNTALAKESINVDFKNEFSPLIIKKIEELIDAKLTKEIKIGFNTATEIAQMLSKELSGNNSIIDKLRTKAVDRLIMISTSRFEITIKSAWYRYSANKNPKYAILQQLTNDLKNIVNGEIKDNWDDVMFGMFYPEYIFMDNIKRLADDLFNKLQSYEQDYEGN